MSDDLSGLFGLPVETGLAADLARERGWMQSPSGWWWREIEDGETIVNGDRIGSFLGSGPYLFADNAEDACLADDLEVE